MSNIRKDVISEEVLFNGDITEPLLKSGQEIYIEQLKATYEIVKVIRSSDNGVVYYIEDKILDTEEGMKQYNMHKQQFRMLRDEKRELKNKALKIRRVYTVAIITMMVFSLCLLFSIYKAV